jgi:hypothetical protein
VLAEGADYDAEGYAPHLVIDLCKALGLKVDSA